MDSNKTGSVTTQDPKNDLDSLFSELLQPDKKGKPAHAENDAGALLSQFLDDEIGGSDAEDLSPDLDLKLAEALKEVGLHREMPAVPKPSARPAVPAVPKNGDSQPAVAAPAAIAPPPAAKPKEAAAPSPAVSAPSRVPAPVEHKPPAPQPASRPARAASGPLSITAAAAAKPAGSHLKFVIMGVATMVVVAVAVYYFMSGSGKQSPQPAPPAAVEQGAPASQPQASPPAMNSAKLAPANSKGTAESSPTASQVKPVEKGMNPPPPEAKTAAAPTAKPAKNSAAPAVATWSPAESIGSAQNLPMPSQAAVRGSDLPMPGAPLPPPPPTAAPASASPSKVAVPVSSRLVPAEPISRVTPIVPEIARKMKVTGVVRVIAKINDQGKVTQAAATEGPTILRSSAEGAVRQWKFKPAQLNGVNVASEATFSIEYRN
jgi:TonB family protein